MHFLKFHKVDQQSGNACISPNCGIPNHVEQKNLDILSNIMFVLPLVLAL